MFSFVAASRRVGQPRALLHVSAAAQARPRPRPNKDAKLQVVLKTDVAGVGAAGAIAGVAHGYARNFLLPAGKAVYATDLNRKLFATAAATAAAASPAAAAADASKVAAHEVAHKVRMRTVVCFFFSHQPTVV
jgi:hypothetical protein